MHLRGHSEAETYADLVIDTHAKFQAARALIPAHLLPLSAVPFEFGPAMALSLGEVHAMRGDNALALPYLLRAESEGDTSIASRAGLMLARLYEQLGRQTEAAPLVAEHATSPELQDYLEFLRQAIR